jgi:hypothetical protein
MITELTPEQWKRCEEVKEEVLQIAFGGGRINEERLKKGLERAYALFDKKLPKVVIVDSPKAAIDYLVDYDASTMLYGSQELYWIAFYKFMEEIGVEYDKELSEKLDILHQISTECEWWFPYEDVVVVSQRPTEVHLNENSVLHNQTGPAVLYADGFSIYSWNGVSVPEEWIENPESLDAHTILTWENTEQRRVGCEIIGWNKILNSLDATIINKDDDPKIGTLYQAEFEGNQEKFLQVLCGTGRTFVLPVPPTMTTALEANAWTFGFDVNDFIPPQIAT